MSHQALADAAGINRSTVSLVESGKRTPTITVCLKIAAALGVNLAALVEQAQQQGDSPLR